MKFRIELRRYSQASQDCINLISCCMIVLMQFCTCISFADEVAFERITPAARFFVTSDSADLMSSPHESGYTTGTVQRGDAVEAYGRLGKEWIAVRPTAGQFDWIAAEYAHLLSGGRTAEILDRPAPAFMHSDSVELSNLQWQIQVQPTQQINVLGQYRQKLDGGKSRAWYKIEPPAGEFRWIRTESVSAQPPRILVVKKKSSADVSTASFTQEAGHNSKTDEVQSASAVITNVESEPIILGPGETIVDHDETALWELTEASSGNFTEQSLNGEYTVDEFGEVVASGNHHDVGSNCPHCTSDTVCSACNSEEDRTIHRLRPISKFLSYLGFAIVEAEVPTVTGCGGCGLSTCNSCAGNHSLLTRASSIGSMPSRLDSLPRPVRSVKRTGEVDKSILFDRLGDARRNLRSSLDQYSASNINDNHNSQTSDVNVSLGSPLHNAISNLRERSGTSHTNDGGSWNGLPDRGLETGDVRLDFQAPTSTQDWSRRPTGESPGTILKTSTPAQKDQSRFTPRPINNSMDTYSDQRLQSCAAELTAVIAKPTEQWHFGSLRQDVESIIQNGSDPILRGEARLLLERIDEFENFRARWLRANSNQIAAIDNHQSESSTSSPIKMASYQRPSSSDSDPEAVSISNLTAAKEIINSADAAGWLVAVHSDRQDYPKFALTDDAGKLVAYIESSPALNLRGYLQQPVAIHGKRGMNALLNARSIYAERVVRLADPE